MKVFLWILLAVSLLMIGFWSIQPETKPRAVYVDDPLLFQLHYGRPERKGAIDNDEHGEDVRVLSYGSVHFVFDRPSNVGANYRLVKCETGDPREAGSLQLIECDPALKALEYSATIPGTH